MDGILLFNKPILWTSHDAVDFVRRRVGQKKVGHAGTLDPLATGLLVMLLGKATKLSSEFGGLDKDYEGIMTFGLATDTLDLEGRILSPEEEGPAPERSQVEETLVSMRGEAKQTPPSYSAVKHKGRPLYDWARRGIAVEAGSKPITVGEFKALDYRAPDLYFFLTCSKGTYVRSLCEEAGRRLGCAAVLSALVRRRVGPFHLDRALGEEELRSMPLERLERSLVPHDRLQRV